MRIDYIKNTKRKKEQRNEIKRHIGWNRLTKIAIEQKVSYQYLYNAMYNECIIPALTHC